jgi:hypothetical protein
MRGTSRAALHNAPLASRADALNRRSDRAGLRKTNPSKKVRLPLGLGAECGRGAEQRDGRRATQRFLSTHAAVYKHVQHLPPSHFRQLESRIPGGGLKREEVRRRPSDRLRQNLLENSRTERQERYNHDGNYSDKSKSADQN